MATIISFANQKGGVGKTTLCTTFANYLSQRNCSVLVIDCDSQQSIYEKRKADETKYKDYDFPYDVKAFSISNTDNVLPLMQKLKELSGIILIDTPGHLSQQGLIPIFAQSDFIVCPYQYEATSISSTATFLKFFKELKGKVSNMKTKLLLVANRYDKRIGKADELKLWKHTDEIFSNYGEVLPRIDVKADMQRYNTISLMDAQESIVHKCYHRITELINIQHE